VFRIATVRESSDVMAQGDEVQPGERLCPDCGRRWYSAALLSEEEAACPECGAVLAGEADGRG